MRPWYSLPRFKVRSARKPNGPLCVRESWVAGFPPAMESTRLPGMVSVSIFTSKSVSFRLSASTLVPPMDQLYPSMWRTMLISFPWIASNTSLGMTVAFLMSTWIVAPASLCLISSMTWLISSSGGFLSGVAGVLPSRGVASATRNSLSPVRVTVSPSPKPSHKMSVYFSFSVGSVKGEPLSMTIYWQEPSGNFRMATQLE